MGCPEPEFEADHFITITFYPNPEVRSLDLTTPGAVLPSPTDPVTDQDTPPTGPDTEVAELLAAFSGEMTGEQLRQGLNLSHKGHFRRAYLQPALKSGLVEMTIPDKPTSRNQRYRLTPRGQKHLKRLRQLR